MSILSHLSLFCSHDLYHMLTFRFISPLSLIQSGKSGSHGGYGSASGDSKVITFLWI